MSRIRARVAALLLTPALLAAGAASAVAAPPESPGSPGVGQSAVRGQGRIADDLAGAPAVIKLYNDAQRNPAFRVARWTATDLQLTLMLIPVDGDVGLEIHHDVDQFFRVESGTATVMMGDESHLGYVKYVDEGDVILIPSGTWHNIVNTGDEPLQLYSIYGPAQHPVGTVHLTQADDPHHGDPLPSPTVGDPTPIEPFTRDMGAVPLVIDIDQATRDNTNFRTAAWTADDLQLTLMDIPVGGDVGKEIHFGVDQFLRVESGKAKVYFGDADGNLRLAGVAQEGSAILVPSGTWHNIVNDSPKQVLELYSIYGPQQHPQGTVHPTQADGEHH